MIDKFITVVPDLRAEIIAEQRRTNDLLAKAVIAISETRAAAPAAIVEQTTKAIEKAKGAAEYAEQKATRTEPPVEQPAKQEPSAPVAAEEAQEPAVDYAYAAKKVTELATKLGREAAVALLAKFDAKTLKGVPEDKYAEVVRACQEVMA